MSQRDGGYWVSTMLTCITFAYRHIEAFFAAPSTKGKVALDNNATLEKWRSLWTTSNGRMGGTYTHMHTHAHVYTSAHRHAHVQTRVHTHNACSHIHTHKYTHAHTLTTHKICFPFLCQQQNGLRHMRCHYPSPLWPYPQWGLLHQGKKQASLSQRGVSESQDKLDLLISRSGSRNSTK